MLDANAKSNKSNGMGIIMDISIKFILQALVRRVWIIILCAVLAFGGAYFYTVYCVDPVYVTTMKVSALSNLQDDESVTSIGSYINIMTLAQRRVQTYVELMKTTTFYQMVADTSGTGYTARAVGSMLYFEQVEGLGIFTVTITGTDPVAIKAIGDAVGQEMYPYIESLQSRTTLVVIEQPTQPTSPVSPVIRNNCMKGALIGAVIAAAVIALFALLDTRIKDEESLTTRYQIPVLGSIPDFTVETGKRSRKA